jgi:hypothetical protein
VFCNFVANALCVVHSVIDVQIELTAPLPPILPARTTRIDWIYLLLMRSIISSSTYPKRQGAEFITDAACKSRTAYTGTSTKIAFSVDGLQIGQPKHFLFSKRDSGSFSVRVVAVVDGSSSVAVSTADPPPKFPLLSEQRALVTYFEAVCFVETLLWSDCFDHECRCQLWTPRASETCRLR